MISRYLLILALITLSIFTSCKKESTVRKSLIGKWELRRGAGQLIIDYPQGNGRILEFTADSYNLYENNQVIQSGTYKITPDNTAEQNVCLVIESGKFANRLDLENSSTNNKVFMELAEDKLELISGCFAVDAGSTRTYLPIR